MKARFIYNPRSGYNRRNPRLLEYAKRFIATHDLDARLAPTERPRHATELALQALEDGCDLVVAIGGDGTMNEVASALVGSPAVFGLIPCGSGNGLGRHLGLAGTTESAFQTLLDGKPRVIDTGSANGIRFFNTMGVGFDAEISDRFNRLSSRGLPAYIRTALSTILRFRRQAYIIRSENASIATDAFIISVANSDQYGNDCFIAPGASVDDGRLNLTVMKSIHVLNVVPMALRLFTKSIDQSSSVQRMVGTHFVIERPAPGLIHTDGETHMTDARVDVTIHPRSLRIMAPPRPVAVSA